MKIPFQMVMLGESDQKILVHLWYDLGNLNFDVKYTIIQFYGYNHNFQFYRWIEQKIYVESPDISYPALEFEVNQSSGRHRNMGHQRLHKFCYFLLFDLWTSYLARIIFLQGNNNLF